MKFEKLILPFAPDVYWTRGYSHAISKLSDKISCSDSQAELLYNLALQLPFRSVIVALGIWTGKSTIAMGEAAKEKSHRIYAVDHFMGSPSDETKDLSQQRDIASEFQANVDKFGLGHWISTIHFPFNELLSCWTIPIDLIFIDGDHEYASVNNDINGWAGWVKVGGIIAGHDYDIPGVEQAVKESFSEFTVEDNIWIAKRVYDQKV